MSLCEIPTPSAELVAKYDEMKGTFFRRIVTAFGKLQEAAGPVLGSAADTEPKKTAKDLVEDMQANPLFQDLVSVGTSLAEDASTLVDKARTAALGLYEKHLRPKVGTKLNEAIDDIKVLLDKYMPVE